jgi:hypothetical protein
VVGISTVNFAFLAYAQNTALIWQLRTAQDINVRNERASKAMQMNEIRGARSGSLIRSFSFALLAGRKVMVQRANGGGQNHVAIGARIEVLLDLARNRGRQFAF